MILRLRIKRQEGAFSAGKWMGDAASLARRFHRQYPSLEAIISISVEREATCVSG
jgi:hypothetical protein